MKTKHLFASVAMAAVLVGCSQEEIVVNDNLQSLGDRPMVEAPVFKMGNVESRMTTVGSYAGVQWEAGDGFGYAVIDTYDPAGTTFATKFTIVDYINSNVMYSTEDGVNFYSHAESSVPEGNYLIYAPFNKDNISRGPLAVSLPLVQNVVPFTNNNPSNTAIADFYKDVKSPVFVGYDYIYGEPKVEVQPELRHLYSLPMVTLKLGEVQLLDEKGKLKVNEDGDPIYESAITINAIEFVNENEAIITEGNIKNSQIEALLKLDLDEDGNPIYNEKKGRYELVWDATEYEKNATSDLLMPKGAKVKYKAVRVNFEGGQVVTTAKNAQFFMVLPGKEYSKADLKIKVYATIDGEPYVLTAESTLTESVAKVIEPAKAATLLPGLPYSADEYNADGTMKTTKGTSMTYTIAGGFSPASVVIDNYTMIADYDDMINFVENIAYRNTELIETTATAAINAIKAGTPLDPKKYFVVTAEEEAPIVLDDNFVAKFKNACVVSGKTGAKITFLGENKAVEDDDKVVLGDITWTSTEAGYFTFATDRVSVIGETVLKAAPAQAVNVLATGIVDLHSNLTTAIKVYNENNGEIKLNSTAEHQIVNNYGTLTVNANAKGKIYNGADSQPEDNEDYFGIMTIADGKNVAAEIRNRTYGKAEIGNAIATIMNNGHIKMTDRLADVQVSLKGTVDNTIGAKVYNAGSNTIYAEVENLRNDNLFGQNQQYDDLTGLNKLVVKGTWTVSASSTLNGTKKPEIRTIDFVSGSSIVVEAATLDLTDVETINIKANTMWRGRKADRSFVTVENGAIVEAANCTLTLKDIAVAGYNKVAAATTTTGITSLIPATGSDNVTISLGGNVSGDGIAVPAGYTGDLVLDLNGKTLDITGNAVGSVGTETLGFQFNEGATVIIRNGTIKATNNSKVKMLIQNYANLTLDNVTLEGNANTEYVLSNNCGEVNIIGNTSITAAAGKKAFDVCVTGYYTEGTQVIVNTTGTITGDVEYGVWGTIPSPINSTLNVKNAKINGNLIVPAALTSAAATNVEVAKDLTITGTGWSTYVK